jgi:hypothetical protein
MRFARVASVVGFLALFVPMSASAEPFTIVFDPNADGVPDSWGVFIGPASGGYVTVTCPQNPLHG